jgi:hypothetical protein
VRELVHEGGFRRRVLGQCGFEPRVDLAKKGDLLLNDLVWHDEGKGA